MNKAIEKLLAGNVVQAVHLIKVFIPIIMSWGSVGDHDVYKGVFLENV